MEPNETQEPSETNVFEGVGPIHRQTFRSGGKGGQHVNKVETGVRVRAAILDPLLLERLRERFPASVNDAGELFVECTSERSQSQNEQLARKRFADRILAAREEPKERVATKPKRSAKEERLRAKRLTKERKEGRKRIEW